jgi:hypothetical protein
MGSNRLALGLWGAGYLVFLAALIWGVSSWSRRTLEQLNTPEARAEWHEYQEQMRHEAEDHAPVRHKISQTVEPPLQVWLRDRFYVILGGVILFGTGFYLIAMFLGRKLSLRAGTPYPLDPDN